VLPVALLILVAVAAGVAAWLGSSRFERRVSDRQAAAELAEQIAAHSPVRRFVHRRLDAEALTGLALTLALLILALAGAVVSLLALLVRRSDGLADVDAALARWAHSHSSGLGHDVLSAISLLASTEGVIVIGVIVGAIELMRLPSRWLIPFLIVVPVGDSLVTNTIKAAVDRARPAIDPAAASLGPSFPSGHSSTAAAFYAALGLLAWRQRPAPVRNVVAGAAVGIAVAVACSRVLLDLHWASDVVAGLALGWAWFAVCAIAFGGPMLRLGAPVEQAAELPAPSPQLGVGSGRSGAAAGAPPASTRRCRGWSDRSGRPGSAR
jgi:undecaprenyl-diphosphatase